MSNMRDLISTLDRLDERQQWDSLDAVVDQYATSGMTLQDLGAMEQAARDVRETGDGGFFSNLRAAGRSLVSNEYFRVNYVLYHAGEKLGLNGMFGTDGMLRTLGDDSMYNAERVRPSDASARNIAVAQARLGILPTTVQTSFGIQAGGQGETMRPTREFFYDPTERSLQGHSISNFRGTEPYIDVTLQRELTRVYTRERNAEALRNAYPNATVMKADGSGPYFEQQATAAPAANANVGTPVPRDRPRDGGNPGGTTTTAAAALEPTGDEYKNTLNDFVASDQRGLANNPEAIGAIGELNTRLSALGFTSVESGSQEYSQATRQAIRNFQTAYNRMYTGTTMPAGSQVPQRISTDGDLGPQTYAALQEVEETFGTIERLLAASGLPESIKFRSSISKMIESIIKEELNTTQLGELTGKLIAIDKFIGAAGENFNIEPKQQMLIRARTAIADHISGMSREPTPNIVRLSNGSITALAGAARTNTGAARTNTGAARTNTGATVTRAVTYTGNFAEDRITFFTTPMARSDAEAFIAAISLEGKDITELLVIDNNLRRVMSVLNGNERVPDEVGAPNGGQIVQKRDAVEVIRTYRQGPLLDAQRNPVPAANSNSDQRFEWGQRTGNTVSGESTEPTGNTVRWEITVENEQVTMRIGREELNTLMSNVDIRQSRDGVTPFEAINNGRSQIYQMPNPEYQNLNNALEYVRDNMLEDA